MGIVWKNTTSSTVLSCDFCAGNGPLQLGVVLVGNRLFYFRKKHIWTYSSKIKVPQFPYCQYVSVYVCTLATANTVWANKLKLEPGSLQMIMSKCIFYLFEILIFWEDMPLSSILMHTTGEKGSNTCFDMWSIIIKGS